MIEKFNFKVKPNEVTETSDYLDGLVMDYRHGSPNSSEALLAAFTPFLGKYFRLLTTGIWDPRDTDTSAFLGLLGTGEQDRIVDKLVWALKMYEPADIQQELVLCLFQTANAYVNVASTFRFILKERILTLITDPLVYSSALAEMSAAEDLAAKEDIEIDQSWVVGIGVGDGWDTLTPMERAVIKYTYHDNMTELAVAKKLQLSRKHLRRYKKTAKEKLARYFHLK